MVVITGHGATGIKWVEARDATKYLTMHMTVLQKIIGSSPGVETLIQTEGREVLPEDIPFKVMVAGSIRDNGFKALSTGTGTLGILGEGVCLVAKARLWSQTSWVWDPVSHLTE